MSPLPPDLRDQEAAAIRGRGFGHGKVILLGEHAVVYDQPALAAGLSRGVWAEIVDGSGTLSAPEWGLQTRLGDGTPMGLALEAMLTRLGIDGVGGDEAGAPVEADVDVRLGGDLPARSGLGSSAAIAVAVARALAEAFGRSTSLALAAAGDAEVVFHGTPSGIDLAAASSGLVGRFQRGVGWCPIDVLQPMTLCVGLSGVQRDTRLQVEAVRQLRAGTPEVAPLLVALGEVSLAGERALGRGDIDELGRLFDVAHGLLAALRVSCLELETLVHLARGAGAVGAKLTGAGKGGAVIALAPGHERDVLARWRGAGFAGFTAQIGSNSAGARPPTPTDREART